jgi:hypothetical protein
LAQDFPDLDSLLAAAERHVRAILPKSYAATARTIRSFFKTPGGRELLREFRELGLI